MNLSTPLQMPTTASMPTPLGNAPVSEQATGSSSDSAGVLGVDFANIMAQQLAPSPTPQRQELAARPGTPEPTTSTEGAKSQKLPKPKETTSVAAQLVAPAVAPAASPAATPMAPLTDTPAPAVSAAVDASLRSVDISPRMRIITGPQQTPSPASLTEFAQSMGLDAHTIAQLLGTAPAQSAQADNKALTNANANAHANANVNILTNGMQATTSSTAPATQGTAQSEQPVHSPIDLQSLTHVQVTVQPLPTDTAVTSTMAQSSSPPSTVEVLSLLAGTLNAPDISTLAGAFEQGDAKTDSESQDDDASDAVASGFAPSLSSATASVNAAAAPTSSTYAVENRQMAEVYDQLSEKLTTEIADRMNQQLGAGQWQMRFALRPAHLGSVDIQLDMKDGTLQATLQADSPLTRDLLKNSSQRLRESLENFAAHAAQVNVGQEGSQSRQQRPQPQASITPDLPGIAAQEAPPATQQVLNPKRGTASLDLYV